MTEYTCGHVAPITCVCIEAENARLQAEARYCNQCRSADETPLNNVVYICFWCEDGFCFEHAAKHFGAEHGGREDLTRERDRYKALAKRRGEALWEDKHMHDHGNAHCTRCMNAQAKCRAAIDARPEPAKEKIDPALARQSHPAHTMVHDSKKSRHER